MRIVVGRPPNFEAIAAVIPAAKRPHVLFTYGDTIYASGGGDISQWLLAHEHIHSLRQGADPAGWWRRYLADVNFRFDEELHAHRIEWMTWARTPGSRNRHDRRAMMRIVAGRLSGPLYGGLVSFGAASRLITESALA